MKLTQELLYKTSTWFSFLKKALHLEKSYTVTPHPGLIVSAADLILVVLILNNGAGATILFHVYGSTIKVPGNGITSSPLSSTSMKIK